MADQVTIDRRFRGPPDSANGGYTCGLAAAFLDGAEAAEVTLRVPPPLSVPLAVERAPASVELRSGETVVAQGRAAPPPELDLPDPVGIDAAARARESSPLHHRHPFPTCFVCGPEREPGDGLRIVCGPVPGREDELLASTWETPGTAGDEVPRELVWSALDCPSGLAGMLVPGLGLTVLGRLTAQLLRPVPAGETVVAIGWPLKREGRKLQSASAVLGESGRPLAIAAATWIELRGRTPGYGG
ncbi:MAG TPA: hypothetical protein VFN15_00520 [Solirubrobacterales bacterium]|nr:hypothetical protein [Solirubrobacterales bacterium]